MDLHAKIILILSLHPGFGCGNEAYLSHEARLKRELLGRYNGLGNALRPLLDSSTPVFVKYGMRLIKLEVDEATQSLVTFVWLRLSWRDELLTWNKTEYGNLSNLNLPPTQIWTPYDVTVVNTIETHVEERSLDVRVRSDGFMFWTPQRRYRTDCLLDLTHYPFDEHSCSIWIQSLAGYESLISIDLYYYDRRNSTPFDLETYMATYANTQSWTITGNYSEKVFSSRDHDVVLMYSRREALKFTLKVKRRPGFKDYFIMFPGILLSFLGTSIFCLPYDRPDRNMLAISLFASFMFLLLVLMENIPPSAAAIPKLVWLYSSNLLVTVTCVLSSVFVINIGPYTENKRPLSPIVHKVIIVYLGKALCVRPGKVIRKNLLASDLMTTNGETSGLKDAEIIDEVKYSSEQRRVVAHVLDRMFFVLFSLFNILLICLLFPRPR